MQIFFQLTVNQPAFEAFQNNYFLVLEKGKAADFDKIPLNLNDSSTSDFGLQLTSSETPSPAISGSLDIDKLLENDATISVVYLWSSSIEQERSFLQKLYIKSNQPILLSSDLTFEPFEGLAQIYPKTRAPNFSCIKKILENTSNLPTDIIPPQDYDSDKAIKYKYQALPESLSNLESTKTESFKSEGSRIEDTQTKSLQKEYELELIDDEEIIPTAKDSVWQVFSIRNVDSLLEGFQEWLKSAGRGSLEDRLPADFMDKMTDDYKIAFWTSGQGVSTMVPDLSPPRHTFVLGILHLTEHTGLAYCIQKPTSLDKIWAHQQWHYIKVIDNKITEVHPVDRF